MAAALKEVSIDLGVHCYKVDAIGEGRCVEATLYTIEFILTGTKQRVWGVGIHEDVVRRQPLALLSAASDASAIRLDVTTDREGSKTSLPTTTLLNLHLITSRPPAHILKPRCDHCS